MSKQFAGDTTTSIPAVVTVVSFSVDALENGPLVDARGGTTTNGQLESLR